MNIFWEKCDVSADTKLRATSLVGEKKTVNNNNDNNNKHSENIQLGHKDGIWSRKMRYANNEKR